ncbi:MAG: hypothetical protein FWE99_07245, partial [Bacteroidales bacterium]|nr:hypothetical protein [Bacteroidales bacterium]
MHTFLRLSLVAAFLGATQLHATTPLTPLPPQEPNAAVKRPPLVAKDTYEKGLDTGSRNPGTPHGKSFNFNWDQSKIFPGSVSQVGVYIPAQYDPEKPACLYFMFDIHWLNEIEVIDNLIHKGDMPVTIVINLLGGVVYRDLKTPPESEKEPWKLPWSRQNRSFSFTTVNDSMARFIIEEILPAVESKQTPDGKPIRISKR